MSKISYFLVPVFLLLLSCNDKKQVTNIKKENIVAQTAKRQVPELTPPPEKPAPKINKQEIVKNREVFKYHIIAASYNTQKPANSFKKRLYKKGYPSIILEKNGKYRVALQSFTNKESAIKELRRLRKLNKKPDLWLLHQ